MEQGIDDEKGGLSVFNKILQDYKVYRNKKVSKKKMKQLIEQPNKWLSSAHHNQLSKVISFRG